MHSKDYTNFVRPTSTPKSGTDLPKTTLSGTEAKKLYLEEVKEVKDPKPTTSETSIFYKRIHGKRKRNQIGLQFCEKELFLSVQNNDIHKLSQILDVFPEKINILDIYGWSLLMIACQANAIDIVKELIKRGIDISVRDKAGNSARSLVIKNRNFVIADILLSYKSIEKSHSDPNGSGSKSLVEQYVCDICNKKTFSNKHQHLSSTLHNYNLSKGKKIPTNYVIPESNKGYQIMLKGGWNKETGLGPDGSGKKYPIKAIQKIDKTGLGHKKKVIGEAINQKQMRSKNLYIEDSNKNRQMEINFRRQFY